ncbi:hypothetical protein FB45DRAFT_177504 [Roridomyces roridus]|uniref:Uncharacterized protein n=1 Tax=Roridomyces roridus TaxID=1738132 RepID=A0AAD7CE43_9AGAR|nr:hypothetical protein FB45DRAFT_177504 [Roridomyces roridus]
MSNDILLILCFVAFLAGQLFNSICTGIAGPVVPSVVAPTGSPLSSVVMTVVAVLLVHDAVILTAVWYYFKSRHMACKTTDMASRIRLLLRTPLLLPPAPSPRRRLLPPPPSLVSHRPLLVVNIAYLARRWVFVVPRPVGSRWLMVPRLSRALLAPQGNDFVVQLAWKAIASFKAVKVAAKTCEGVVLNTFDLLNLSVVVQRPLRAPSIWRVRILPSLWLYQDLTGILLLVNSALAARKALKPPLQDVSQDDSVTSLAMASSWSPATISSFPSSSPVSPLLTSLFPRTLISSSSGNPSIQPLPDARYTSRGPRYFFTAIAGFQDPYYGPLPADGYLSRFLFVYRRGSRPTASARRQDTCICLSPEDGHRGGHLHLHQGAGGRLLPGVRRGGAAGHAV